MEFRTGSINFPKLRDSGPVTQIATVHFPREVVRAVAGITGYTSLFSNRNDHPLGLLQVKLDTENDGDLVKVTGSFGLRDWSGEWDDDYEGNIDFVVVAELASASQPHPRGDLSITGMEFNQATQHFRSSRHLDPDNIRPDNSIPLIARKDTAVRVYVDYDSSSGLPLINTLTGELDVDTGFNVVTILPSDSITPMRDNQINRGEITHTLNFIIPESLCQTQLTLRCKVFDAFNPTPASRIFERTIYFENRVALSLYAVGIHYIGQGLDLPAPALPDIVSTDAFSKMEVVYPVPEVLISGYTEIDFDKDMKADINNGCGDGYNSLLDTLRDMAGSSSDVYYGFLPTGFDGGSVGGCGGGSGRVAASPFTAFGGLAQETGHAFGRKHAPCDSSTRCGNPANQDDNYPQYAEFDSDSIGEFGFNPRTNELFSPVDSHDFMSYSGNRWVSPYTYMGLLGSFPSSDGITAFALRSFLAESSSVEGFGNQIVTEGPWIDTETMKLFLWLEIDRKRKVTRLPSFHFYTRQLNENDDEPSDFSVELVDQKGKILTCQPLVYECANCGANCFPKIIRQYIPYDEKAKKLIIYEGDNGIYEEEIVTPEEHVLKHEYVAKDKRFELQWGGKENLKSKYHYIVHWQDRDGQFRGLSGRTQETKASIPATLFGGRNKMRIRLYYSSGIATGMIEDTLTLSKPEKNDVQIIPLGNKNTTNWFTVGLVENNRMIPGATIVWYDNKHQEIARGRSVDLKKLKKDVYEIHAVAIHNGNRYTRTLPIENGKIHIQRPIVKLNSKGAKLKWKSKTAQ